MMKTPKWFQEWEANEFKHLVRDVWWIKWMVIALVASVVTAAVTRLI